MEKLLYEASLDGNVDILLMLLQEDPLILDRVTLNRHGDTPLHIASMLGNVDFVKEVITRKPHLAMERDAQNRVPLHIASAKGHTEIVKLLISAKPETCLVRDGDGRNSLHFAAVKGRCEVVKVLVQAQPHAARAMVQQKTILHLCVNYNQLEVLKILVETVGDHEFVNTKDADGNTILHLAVADKQIETINFLVLNTTIEVNASNINGETLMDILAKGQRDVKDQQIILSLRRAQVVDADNESLLEQIAQNSRGKMVFAYKKKKKKKNDGDWLDKKRNILILVASLIATMAFQAGINPPGGVSQEDKQQANRPSNTVGFVAMEPNYNTTGFAATEPKYNTTGAGFAVMALRGDKGIWHTFLICNTVGFVSTLSIILLLISGLPFLKRPFFMWVLRVIMWVATASMLFTYLTSIVALTPTNSYSTTKLTPVACIILGIVFVWLVLTTLLVVGHVIRLIIKSVKSVINMCC